MMDKHDTNDTEPQEIIEPRMNTITAIYTKNAESDSEDGWVSYRLKNADVTEDQARKEINDYCLGLPYSAIDYREIR